MHIEEEVLDGEDSKAGREEEVAEASQEAGEKERTELTPVKPQENTLLVSAFSWKQQLKGQEMVEWERVPATMPDDPQVPRNPRDGMF